MNKGYIYVLANSMMVDTFKIGKTERTPKERAKELSNVTCVPTPYVVVYHIFVNDCNYIEKKIHDYFKKYRINDKREFFNADIKSIIDYMIQLNLEFGIKDDNYNEFNENKINQITGSYYDIKGYDYLGFNKNGIHKITGCNYDKEGYNREGYNREGYNKEGFNRVGRLVVSKK